jgi:uncharacterized protein (DUF362 family)/Pyruvate/2-oxoacid:ferredoxin oxidoreductase delta subunit
MEHERVALVGCDSYDAASVEASVARAFELVGGAESVAGAGETVFVKVNAVMGVDPATAIVTNPTVVEAVIRQFQGVTGRVTFGDSPGGPFTRPLLKRVYEKTGLAGVAARTGAELAFDTGTVEVPLPGGEAVKRLVLCRSMVEADRLVSIAKFKTHRYMNLTGPIKNLYGTVAGMNKFIYHSRFEDPAEFADLIVDVHLAARPAFHVVDAVDVIDGDGSRKGTVRRMGAIAAGRNAFALESLMMELVGLPAAENMPFAAAIGRGLCPEGPGWFEVLGDRMDDFRLDEFRLPGENLFSERMPALVTGRLSRFVTETPKPLRDLCVACGTCAKVCPRQAITIREGLARVDTRKCIRCFCCDELCEHGAVGVRRPLLLRLARTGG